MIKITIICAGGETHYLYGLINGLAKINDLFIDVIDSYKSAGLFDNLPNVRHFNLRRDQNPNVGIIKKIIRVYLYYIRLIVYAARTNTNLFHIQWLNKFYFFDRTFLLIYYKLLGKKIVYTAHNVDDYGRPGQKSSKLNKWSLKFFYKYVDHIIVHTKDSKIKVAKQFNIPLEKISIIPHGINNKFPLSNISMFEARRKLDIPYESKIILFFGRFEYYKGVDQLIDAFDLLVKSEDNLYLILAGFPSNKKYVDLLKAKISEKDLSDKTIVILKFLDDYEIELIMKAADCLVLPYRGIYQSGVLFLGYAFGIPIIASNVGNFPNDILINRTGFLFNKEDVNDLASKIKEYFNSKLYLKKDDTRKQIINYANIHYSWNNIALKTFKLYKSFLENVR